jgi:thymidylate synthase (FAD)
MQREGLSLGIPAEDVRFALTNATETRFVITTNARQLRHMFNLRCCRRAQWEIRRMFNMLLAEYKKIAPNIFYKAGPSCEDFGYCPEGKMSCGRAPTMDELQEAYRARKKQE